MNCISIRQPYAELILSGRKSIELRNWMIMKDETIYLHVGSIVDYPTCKQHGIPYAIDKTCGNIVGSFHIVDIKTYNDLNEFTADKDLHLSNQYYRYGHILSNIKRLVEPIKGVKGNTKIFHYLCQIGP